jgi:hypothetical protein
MDLHWNADPVKVSRLLISSEQSANPYSPKQQRKKVRTQSSKFTTVRRGEFINSCFRELRPLFSTALAKSTPDSRLSLGKYSNPKVAFSHSRLPCVNGENPFCHARAQMSAIR